MKRIKAILYALYFGVMPYWVYEDIKHYDCTYFEHLTLNLKYAYNWLLFQETKSDHAFEKEVNNNY